MVNINTKVWLMDAWVLGGARELEGGGGGGRKGELSFPDAIVYHILATSINCLPPELALCYVLA